MAAMLVNRFKMRREVLTYSLAGMGCSSSIVCVDLARHMLKVGHVTPCAYVPDRECSCLLLEFEKAPTSSRLAQGLS